MRSKKTYDGDLKLVEIAAEQSVASDTGIDVEPKKPIPLHRRYATILIKTSGGNLSLDCDITGYNLDEIFECLLKKCKKYLEKSDELTDIYFYTEERYEK